MPLRMGYFTKCIITIQSNILLVCELYEEKIGRKVINRHNYWQPFLQMNKLQFWKNGICARKTDFDNWACQEHPEGQHICGWDLL